MMIINKVTREIEARSLVVGDIEKSDGTSTPTYTAYTIGQEVTLKDNTTWYVIENSETGSDIVTFLYLPMLTLVTAMVLAQ